jgi:nitrogen PTS system EIIA component
MKFSVKDVSEMIGVSEKTIYRMIKNETIPCFRIGGQWRFDVQELISWLEDTRAFSYDTAVRAPSKEDEEHISISEFLQRGGIYYDVSGATKETAILHSLERIQTRIPQMDTKNFFTSIMERERLCPTSVGHGIAIPHPRFFKTFMAISYISLCFLSKPIPFGALDKEYVDILIFIFPRSERRFLRIESKLLRLLKDEEVMSTVKKAASEDAIYSVFSKKESEIFKDNGGIITS